MKIGILTFHCAYNFGAMLQAYALQQQLLESGHDAYILDYRPRILFRPYRIFPYRARYRTENFFRYIYHILKESKQTRTRYSRRKFFRRFEKDYFRLHSFDPKNPHHDFDVIIYGSDQIWNPMITNYNIYPAYFAQMEAARTCTNISYAASAGSPDAIEPYRDFFIKALSRFNNISVRETSLAQWIETNTSIPAPETVLDPTLLVDPKIFSSISAKPLYREPYLLVFQLFSDPGVLEAARYIANRKGLRLIYLTAMQYLNEGPDHLNAISVGDFVSLIANASYVVTSSFHGTAFSIIFKRDFISLFPNPEYAERVKNLLTLLQIPERILSPSEFPQKADSVIGSVDYSLVTPRLEELRCSSRKWLANALVENS